MINLLAVIVLFASWTLSLTYITVFYHRGLAHRSLTFRTGPERVLLLTGNWVTGTDAVGWVAMHRLHHLTADTPDDPHSPLNVGLFGVARAQLRSYKRALARLLRGDAHTLALVSDLEDDDSWLNRQRVWWMPYATQLPSEWPSPSARSSGCLVSPVGWASWATRCRDGPSTLSVTSWAPGISRREIVPPTT
jgi:hypothetical protein